MKLDKKKIAKLLLVLIVALIITGLEIILWKVIEYGLTYSVINVILTQFFVNCYLIYKKVVINLEIQ